MPIFLEPRDVSDDLAGVKSVLIVSCPICPPMCLSIQKQKPFIEFFKHGFKTAVFEDHIQSIRKPLERRGIRTGAFTMRLPIPMMCLWTEKQRARLLKRAKAYEAVIVLGCDSATHTARDTLKDTDCRVLQAMTVATITNAKAKFRFPGTVNLEWTPLPTQPAFAASVTPSERTHQKDEKVELQS